MAWVGSICDSEIARRASSSGLIAQNILNLVDGDLATVATAQAACFTNEAALSICDRLYAVQCSRGFKVADNMDATFGSTFTAFYASLPDNNGNQQRMITG